MNLDIFLYAYSICPMRIFSIISQTVKINED